jgi:hypothetical protein
MVAAAEMRAGSSVMVALSIMVLDVGVVLIIIEPGPVGIMFPLGTMTLNKGEKSEDPL